MNTFHAVKKTSSLNMLKEDICVNNLGKAYSIRKPDYDRYNLFLENN